MKGAETWWGASIAQVGRAFNNAGYDVAQSVVGTVARRQGGGRARRRRRDPVGTLSAIGDATLKASDALGDAVMHPVDTANQLASDVSKIAGTLKGQAEKYLATNSVGDIAEDLLRVGVGSLAEAGVGKVMSAATAVASKSLGLADEAAAVAGALRKAENRIDQIAAR